MEEFEKPFLFSKRKGFSSFNKNGLFYMKKTSIYKITDSLLFIIFLAIAIRLYQFILFPVASGDGIFYIDLAKKVIEGNWVYVFSSPFTPLYPILLAIISKKVEKKKISVSS